MSVSPAQKNFINAARFAVIGRVLTDRSRWDNKVLRWYQDHKLSVTPVLPTAAAAGAAASSAQVEGLAVTNDPTKLDELSNTSISIIINPAIGLGILKSLYPPSGGRRQTRSNSGPRGIWFQPGAENDEIRAYVKEMGLEERVVLGGPCILEDGEEVLQARAKL